MINWRVRIKNKLFWLAIIPAVLMLIRTVAAVFGFEIDFSILSDKLAAVVEAAFAVLAILGIVVDPTTDGVADSSLAMTYDAPRKAGEPIKLPVSGSDTYHGTHAQPESWDDDA